MGPWRFLQDVLAIPLVLLFSYNKKTRFKWLDAVSNIYYVLHYIVLFIAVLVMLVDVPQMILGRF